MPKALKGFLQFIFGLAICVAFVYSRIGPGLRASRAIQRASTQAPRSATKQDARPVMQLDSILSFAVDVSLRKNSALEVREEFVAHSAGDYFRYGMIRELPIDSEARWDRRLVGPYAKDTGIRVRILEATEDGAPVSYEQGSDSGYPQLRLAPW